MAELSDAGSERAVLAGIFQYGDAVFYDICDIVTPETFTNYNNQIIYRCVDSIIREGRSIDLQSILSVASTLGFSDIVNTPEELEYISLLFKFHVNQDNVKSFASKICKLDYAKKIQRIAKEVQNSVDRLDGSESVDYILGLLENPVSEFLREDSSASDRPELISENIDDYFDFLLENKCDQVGIATGMPYYDAAIGGGLRRKCVDLISARPKVGKSTIADNVAIHVASNGIPVLMLDTEMSKEDHLTRIAANLAKIPINDIATGKFGSPERLARMEVAKEKIKAMPYHYESVAGKPFESIMSIIKRWIMQEVGTDDNGVTKDCLVVYDYLKLMSSSSVSSNIAEYQALGFQITDLHNLTVKYDFSCLSFVQLNREGDTKESATTVSGSDRLIWLCTSFSQFKFKSDEEAAEDGPRSGNRKLVPLICRHGPAMSDGDYININMFGEYCKIQELKTRSEMKDDSGEDSGLISQENVKDIEYDG